MLDSTTDSDDPASGQGSGPGWHRTAVYLGSSVAPLALGPSCGWELAIAVAAAVATILAPILLHRR